MTNVRLREGTDFSCILVRLHGKGDGLHARVDHRRTHPAISDAPVAAFIEDARRVLRFEESRTASANATLASSTVGALVATSNGVARTMYCPVSGSCHI